MFYRFISYLKFCITSTNQYGVHSPFIYDYVTKCLYGKKKYKASKTMNVLLKSIAYFGAKNVQLISKNEHLKDLIKKEFSITDFDSLPSDIIYMDNQEVDGVYINLLPNNHHNNTMVLIDSIRTNRKNSIFWETAKMHGDVRVTIDMFYCGALFFRKEQAKEHFKIRL